MKRKNLNRQGRGARQVGDGWLLFLVEERLGNAEGCEVAFHGVDSVEHDAFCTCEGGEGCGGCVAVGWIGGGCSFR